MLGLYIHIPFCVQKCKYCDFNSYKIEKDKKEKFLNDLKKEMSLYKNKLSLKHHFSLFSKIISSNHVI